VRSLGLVTPQPLNVLVVDDDDAVRLGLAELLASAGIRVVAAVDGQHALELLATGFTPCAVLLDWVMPRVNGDAFLRARAGSSHLSSVPVYVVSATHLPEADARMQGFLEKPLDVGALLPMLRDVCALHCPSSRSSKCQRLAGMKREG
jgi:CheY-like chemotaxis protein